VVLNKNDSKFPPRWSGLCNSLNGCVSSPWFTVHLLVRSASLEEELAGWWPGSRQAPRLALLFSAIRALPFVGPVRTFGALLVLHVNGDCSILVWYPSGRSGARVMVPRFSFSFFFLWFVLPLFSSPKMDTPAPPTPRRLRGRKDALVLSDPWGRFFSAPPFSFFPPPLAVLPSP